MRRAEAAGADQLLAMSEIRAERDQIQVERNRLREENERLLKLAQLQHEALRKQPSAEELASKLEAAAKNPAESAAHCVAFAKQLRETG